MGSRQVQQMCQSSACHSVLPAFSGSSTCMAENQLHGLTLTMAALKSLSPHLKPFLNSCKIVPSGTSLFSSERMASWKLGSKGYPTPGTASTPRLLKLSTICLYRPYIANAQDLNPAGEHLFMLLLLDAPSDSLFHCYHLAVPHDTTALWSLLCQHGQQLSVLRQHAKQAKAQCR